MLVNSSASCFIDAMELAMPGIDAQEIRRSYLELAPDSNPDEIGYHATLVNMVMMETYQIGLTKIDCIPSILTGEALPGGEVVGHRIAEWFRRPGFRCILTGVDKLDGNHANGYALGRFFDPGAPDNVLGEPSIRIESIWIITLPPELPDDQT